MPDQPPPPPITPNPSPNKSKSSIVPLIVVIVLIIFLFRGCTGCVSDLTQNKAPETTSAKTTKSTTTEGSKTKLQSIGTTIQQLAMNVTLEKVDYKDGILTATARFDAKDAFHYSPEYLVAVKDSSNSKQCVDKDKPASKDLKAGESLTVSQAYQADTSYKEIKWVISSTDYLSWDISEALKDAEKAEKDAEKAEKAAADSVIQQLVDEHVSAKDAYDQLNEAGYTFTFVHEKSQYDLTGEIVSFIKDPDDEYPDYKLVGFRQHDPAKKSVILLVNTPDSIKDSAAKDALEDKLRDWAAIGAVRNRGKIECPYGFKLGRLISLTAKDEDTWFIKAECKVTNGYGAERSSVVEANVTGTTDSPSVTSFELY